MVLFAWMGRNSSLLIHDIRKTDKPVGAQSAIFRGPSEFLQKNEKSVRAGPSGDGIFSMSNGEMIYAHAR
jgi:hypothetical protein